MARADALKLAVAAAAMRSFFQGHSLSGFEDDTHYHLENVSPLILRVQVCQNGKMPRYFYVQIKEGK